MLDNCRREEREGGRKEREGEKREKREGGRKEWEGRE